MSDAAKVQDLPKASENSIDVLESLHGEVSYSIFQQLRERVDLGVKKYGSRLQTLNGRNSILDCTQEALDGIMYAQQGVLEGRIPVDVRDAFINLADCLITLARLNNLPTTEVTDL